MLEAIYRFKQRLCYLLLKKHRTRKQCEQLVPRFLRAVYQLRQAGLAQLVQLGQTLSAWSEEIVAMWRFTRNNGITEGFHNKMELINRQAYGFRNFQNYRLTSEGVMFLETSLGSGLAPVVGTRVSWWTAGDSNPRPRRCERRALPAELAAHFQVC